MPINPAIALGVKGLELPDPLAQYSRVAAIQQAQQQNALAQMQMQEYARSLKEGEEIRNRLAAGANFADPTFQNFMLGTKTGRDALQRQAALVTAQTEEEKRRAELRQKVGETYRDLTNIIKNRDDAVDWLTKFHTDPAMQNSPLARFPLEQLTQRIPSDPEGLDNWIKQSAVGYTKWVTENKKQLSTKDTGGAAIDRTFEPLTGKIAEIGRTAKTMTPSEAKNVALREREVVVREQEAKRNADPEFIQRKAAAEQLGKDIVKNQVAAQQALPTILSNAQAGIDLIDQMVGKQEVRDKSNEVIQAATKPHPGFQNAVGATWLPGIRFVPGSDAAGFQALFDQVQGAAFLDAFNALRGAGAITEKEGAKATAARTRMSLAQDEKEFVKAAREYQDVIRKGVENARLKAGGAAAPAGAPTVSNW